ncbi:NAD(P)-dependent dehydrogenase (short-subunit alcohol dehydrogenase family) [Cytobacillus eiseniae]|uniref:NAD(P)-dependent dehydrogenase (Short-subunit alcohol dehydrogenase family) n=1 Tax=Cytobacillus eiseniae TaxID=762947 RepID=A0ABS4REZ1_9BACI|nr:SDR family oxidoreductase [Cytobacillus eiseniae]MBP2241483.1 NAD(P)-dependent dehydrogenase (short-subunit alcohol dehydrogenase family) [Cytobacillus eiseniae]
MNQDYPVYLYLDVIQKVVQQPIAFPPQHQKQQPGLEWAMVPRPIFDYAGFKGSGKLKGKVALITGGDSGIGRAVAVAFAKEGADLTIVYLNEEYDAMETKQYVEQFEVNCHLIQADLRDPSTSQLAVTSTIEKYGRLDIVVNNAAVQPFTEDIMDVSDEQLEDTFRTNVFALFYMIKAALPHLKKGSSIINTTSRVAYEGDKNVIDYSSSKGAVVTFTRSMALSLVEKGIRVNAVAPGPAWTPLTVSTYPADHVAILGTDIPMGRAAQPFEIAPAFVYLATDHSFYVTGQTLHVNGGIIRYS